MKNEGQYNFENKFKIKFDGHNQDEIQNIIDQKS